MIDLVREASVNCYLSMASILVMVVLLIHSDILRQRKTDSLRIFFLFCCTVTVTCVCNYVYNLMYGQTAPWTHSVALISRTLQMFFFLTNVILWIVYVDYKLFGGYKDWTLRRILRIAPLIIILVLLLINLFTPIMFEINNMNRNEYKPLAIIFTLIIIIYFFSSYVSAIRFDRKSQKIRFVRITPMMLSITLGNLPMLFFPYDTNTLGFSIGVTLVYFSMITELRYVDDESGLYNRSYLGYLFDMAVIGKTETHSALILEVDGSLSDCVEILREVLHRDGDVIRVEERKFLMFSNIDSRSTLEYLSSLVDEAVTRHNTEHAEEKVQISTRCRMRMPNEDPLTFLRSVTEEKEAGDEMRGIVSMISELDRLDEELKLAADIQINTLPMSFPPFPEHREFDLYASMIPAKEVGGDFYDFFLIDNDHLALVIADVSGKGIPAALFMMTSKSLIKNQLLTGCDPATALDQVNQQLCERDASMMFVTVWLAVLEISSGKGMACNAGHENPGLRRTDGTFELLKYRHGMAIGISELAKYKNREFQLAPGDCIFVYTDGVPEATDAAYQMFGDFRLTATLNQNPNAGPEELVHRMHEAVDRFVNGAPQFDDTTMLCLKYYGTQENS